MAAQVSANAKTKTKPIPKAKASTNTKTSAETDAENNIGSDRGDVSSTDTDSMMGDGPSKKPQESG